jgi:hypothetical protein
MILLTRVDARQIERLLGILDAFSAAMGLTINYHKSTLSSSTSHQMSP